MLHKLDYLKLVIEDTAIDITCHSKCNRHITENLDEACYDLTSYFNNEIYNFKDYKIYIKMLKDLMEYSLKIPNTCWDDYLTYQKHINFIKEYQEKFKIPKPIIINYIKKPFGDKLSLDIQELILKIKFQNESKYHNRYEFLLSYTNPLLQYLEQKKRDASPNGIFGRQIN